MGSCSGITGAGERCRAIAITGSDYCHAHDPSRAEARKRAARKGGKIGGRGRPAAHTGEITEVKDRIRTVVNGVLLGKIHCSKGNTVAALYNVLLRAIEVELACREQEDLIERLEELELLMEQQKGRRGYGT